MSLPITDANGVVQTKLDGVPVVWNAGLGYDATGKLCVTAQTSVNDVWQGGRRISPQGLLVVSLSTPGGQPFNYNAGWPFDKVTGAVITQTGVPAPSDPRVAGIAVGPLGGVYMTEGGWTPATLWPNGAASPGLWNGTRYLNTVFWEGTGVTPVKPPGTVLDTSNPIGLILDKKGGATSVTDPGLHLSQATSDARPVASARRNLLTKTEDFADVVWSISNASKTPNSVVAPDGTTTACKVTATVASGQIYQMVSTAGTLTSAHAFYVKRVTGAGAVGLKNPSGSGVLDITATLDSTWKRFTSNATGPDGGSSSYYPGVSMATAGDEVAVWHPQLNLGSTATDYQRVNTASDYDASVAQTYAKLDGVDDEWKSAVLTANTELKANMTILMAVRRDNAAAACVGMYMPVSTSRFGDCIPASGAAHHSGCGFPTTWVDGVQLANNTAGALDTAMTPGPWHIFELRGLDLAAWTAIATGLQTTSGKFNGGDGEIMLFANPTADDLNKARDYLADYFGVALPAFTGRYTYSTPPTAVVPNAGEIVHGDNLINKLNFSKVDLDGQAYTGPPLEPGHSIKVGNQIYTMDAPPVDFGAYYTLTIDPVTQLADGTYTLLVY